MERAAAAAKKHFDRYTDPRMRPLDRVVGNTLEWMPVFLGLFWLSVLLGADTIMLGWGCVLFGGGLVGGGCRAGLALQQAAAAVWAVSPTKPCLQTPKPLPDASLPAHAPPPSPLSYVAMRVVYAILAYAGMGISKTVGAKTPILLATVPAYAILWMLGREVGAAIGIGVGGGGGGGGWGGGVGGGWLCWSVRVGLVAGTAWVCQCLLLLLTPPPAPLRAKPGVLWCNELRLQDHNAHRHTHMLHNLVYFLFCADPFVCLMLYTTPAWNSSKHQNHSDSLPRYRNFMPMRLCSCPFVCVDAHSLHHSIG